jgi:hypothetical protein
MHPMQSHSDARLPDAGTSHTHARARARRPTHSQPTNQAGGAYPSMATLPLPKPTPCSLQLLPPMKHAFTHTPINPFQNHPPTPGSSLWPGREARTRTAAAPGARPAASGRRSCDSHVQGGCGPSRSATRPRPPPERLMAVDMRRVGSDMHCLGGGGGRHSTPCL